MTIIGVEEAKVHLRLDPEPDSDQDPYIEDLIAAAEDYAAQFMGREELPWDSSGAPASVRAAILLIIGDLYENREGAMVGVSRVDNPAVERLLHFYRVGLGI